jgi:uncharacterized protein YpmB
MKKLLIIIGVLVVIVVIALVFLLGENTKMKEIFKKEVQAEMDKNAPNNEVITEEDISELPEPVQRYFRYCGIKNRPHHEIQKIHHIPSAQPIK